MTLKELKRKYLALIEELSPNSDQLTDDPDIAAKQTEVINQIMFELARMKKIPKYVEMPVKKGQVVEFGDIEALCGYDIYQICLVSGVSYIPRAGGTVMKFQEDGTAEIDLYVYPERITENTSDSHELELTQDVLEIMPYGIAADLLKSDVSAEYGSVYATRYETMMQRLDPRYQMSAITIEGGVDV